jgi:hypothetical protein
VTFRLRGREVLELQLPQGFDPGPKVGLRERVATLDRWKRWARDLTQIVGPAIPRSVVLAADGVDAGPGTPLSRFERRVADALVEAEYAARTADQRERGRLQPFSLESFGLQVPVRLGSVSSVTTNDLYWSGERLCLKWGRGLVRCYDPTAATWGKVDERGTRPVAAPGRQLSNDDRVADGGLRLGSSCSLQLTGTPFTWTWRDLGFDESRLTDPEPEAPARTLDDHQGVGGVVQHEFQCPVFATWSPSRESAVLAVPRIETSTSCVNDGNSCDEPTVTDRSLVLFLYRSTELRH